MPKRRLTLNYLPENPLRIVIYLRVSSHGQNPRSLDQQLAMIRAEIHRLGYPWVEVRIFRDEAVSGRLVTRRPGLMEMLDLIRSGHEEIDLVVVDTPERIGRSEHVPRIRDELRRNGALLVDAHSHFRDPTTRDGRVLAFLGDTQGEAENDIKGYQVRRGKEDAIKRKLWAGGPPPTGYLIERCGIERRKGRDVILKRLAPNAHTKILPIKASALALQHGWGSTRVTKALNADPEIPADIKPVFDNTITRILVNPIYFGKMVWRKFDAGYVDDIRVVEQNPEEDWIVVENYCEPLISEADFWAFQKLRRARQEAWSASRSPQEELTSQVGVALKYPLSGLVVCGSCGYRMVITQRKRGGGQDNLAAYHCPYVRKGICQNRVAVSEPWLLAQATERIIGRLFLGQRLPSFTPEELLQSPVYAELETLVEQELARSNETRPLAHESLRAELAQLQQFQAGVRQSLDNPKLDISLRRELEQTYGERSTRIIEINAALQGAANMRSTADSIVRPDQIASELTRIAAAISGDNHSAANLQLARIFDDIVVAETGTVRLRMCKLGFLVPPDLLPAMDGENGRDELGGNRRRMPARAVPRDTCDVLRGELPPDTSFDRARFAAMTDDWFWTEELPVPVKRPWHEEHALEVAQSRLDAPCGKETLAERFGVVKTTIWRALKHAKKLGLDATKIDGRGLHANWARDHATEVAEFVNGDRTRIPAAARHFGKSRPWIRKALDFADEAAAQPGEDCGSDIAEEAA